MMDVGETGLRAAIATLGLVLGVVGAALAAPSAPRPPAAPNGPDLRFFEARIRPLLALRCFGCHGEKAGQGGLRLHRAEAVAAGGDSGAAVVPGQPDASRLINAVRYTGKPQMPPSGKLPAGEIALLEEWVRRGAPFPAAAPISAAASPMGLTEGRRWWSIRPFAKAAPPPTRRRGWTARPLDTYVLARLEKAGLSPSPAADRRTLIRRASFDLTGLPPAPEEVESFVADPSPDAYARLIDRLLASPHYGERWGRHWLDLTRYCDVPEEWARTEAQPWLYRDWVVRAVNEDVPYPRFVELQLAADQAPNATPDDLAALGFLGLSPTYWKELKLAPDVIKTVVAEEWEERITAVTGTFLALTVGCARCHDHKQDPIPTRDYYALAGVFASVRQTPLPLVPVAEIARVREAHRQVATLEGRAKAEAPRAAELRAEATRIRQATPYFDAPVAYGVDDAGIQVLPDGPDRTRIDYRMGTPQDVAMQVRGNPTRPGSVVPRGFLTVLSPGQPVIFRQGSGRRELAGAIFNQAGPLAARVMVNRVWKHHFGRGLSETPSNFGTMGDRPTHPELLDDLARRFIAAGWSLKWLHREIMLSATYRQGSPHGPSRGSARDPDNTLLWRMAPRRLEVEAWRDAILAASGSLDPRVGGPPAELGTATNVRRTLYGTVRRRELDDVLRLFDFPDPIGHSPARFHTTTPLQQLYVLNSDFTARRAGAFARRVTSEVPTGSEAQVRRAYALLYGRRPSPTEATAGQRFLGEAPNPSLWQEYAEVLLSANELMYVL